MESLFKNMDFPVKHWAPFPRRFPSAFPVESAAYIEKKDHRIRRSFRSCNFSLILRGRGEYRRCGRLWPVQAPCVITQWPEEPVEYGPFLPKETWDEFYIIYPSSCFDTFRKCGFVHPSTPTWPILNLSAVLTQLEEFASLSRSAQPEQAADQIDRACERLILETLLPVETGSVMQKIAREFNRHPEKPFDLRKAASQHSLSESGFRRRWAADFKTPPARYLLDLRIRKACRLLAESAMAVNEIARLCGFEDALYFSRRFRLQTKLTPRDYRRLHQIRKNA